MKLTAAYVLMLKAIHALQTAAGRTFAGCNKPSGDPCTSAAGVYRVGSIATSTRR
jgi:hypothetical protein